MHWVDHLNNAERYLVRHVQSQCFESELTSLKTNKPISSRSKLLPLTPFIDEFGLLRVGGRLGNLSCSTDLKHPIILPKVHRFVELVIADSHAEHLHPGPSLQSSLLKQRFWIISCRSIVRSYINRCMVCFKLRHRTMTQLMGNLPLNRLQPCRPFMYTGVDYAGPISLKSRHGRGKIPITKGYIALFICLTTKAAHIELVSSMSSESFIASLRRFISRRGHPAEIVADNGTNFIGARRELEELHKLFESYYTNLDIFEFCSQRKIRFLFNPARAPHFGGIWEANIKCIKHHLRRVTSDVILTFEEMTTLLCQIESLLNSRPLCPVSEDVDDLNVLTPGHFLTGAPLTLIPEPPLADVPLSRLSRFQLIQDRVQSFWRKWQLEVIHTLQQRPKWQKVEPNLKVGDLVLVADDHLPAANWLLGRVIILHPGNDHLVRVVTIRTSTSTLKRPVVKLAKLPIDAPCAMNPDVDEPSTGGE